MHLVVVPTLVFCHLETSVCAGDSEVVAARPIRHIATKNRFSPNGSQGRAAAGSGFTGCLVWLGFIIECRFQMSKDIDWLHGLPADYGLTGLTRTSHPTRPPVNR